MSLTDILKKERPNLFVDTALIVAYRCIGKVERKDKLYDQLDAIYNFMDNKKAANSPIVIAGGIMGFGFVTHGFTLVGYLATTYIIDLVDKL